MHLEKRNPEAPGRALRVKSQAEVNTDDTIEISTGTQRRAAARIAAQFGLSMSVALVVATLAGLGGVA